MKVIFKIITVFILVSLYSCTKKDSTTTTSPKQPIVTNFSVNGVAANSPNPSAAAIGGNYIISATDNTNYYPEIQIAFSGTNAPGSGTYNIVKATPGVLQCSFILTPNTSTNTASAASGVVTITAATTPNNTASFSQVICTATGTTTTTYTITGTIKY